MDGGGVFGEDLGGFAQQGQGAAWVPGLGAQFGGAQADGELAPVAAPGVDLAVQRVGGGCGGEGAFGDAQLYRAEGGAGAQQAVGRDGGLVVERAWASMARASSRDLSSWREASRAAAAFASPPWTMVSAASGSSRSRSGAG
jgi:hypothetical protein